MQSAIARYRPYRCTSNNGGYKNNFPATSKYRINHETQRLCKIYHWGIFIKSI